MEIDAVSLQEKYREDISWMKNKLLKLKERYYESFIDHSKVPKIQISIPKSLSVKCEMQYFQREG